MMVDLEVTVDAVEIRFQFWHAAGFVCLARFEHLPGRGFFKRSAVSEGAHLRGRRDHCEREERKHQRAETPQQYFRVYGSHLIFQSAGRELAPPAVIRPSLT